MKRRHRVAAGAWLLAALLIHAPLAGAGEGPYALEAGREAAFLGTGAALVAASRWAERGSASFTPEEVDRLDPARVPALDRATTRRWSPAASRFSDGLLVAMGTAPFALALAGEGRDEPAEPLTMYAETIVVAWGATALLKNVFPRARPFVYNPDPAVPADEKRGANARRSFPSGHAAATFASAVFLGTVFSELHPESTARPVVWGTALVGATTTAWLRVRAGRHFPTDVLAGAALGAAVGYAVPALHRGSEAGEATPALRVTVRF